MSGQGTREEAGRRNDLTDELKWIAEARRKGLHGGIAEPVLWLGARVGSLSGVGQFFAASAAAAGISWCDVLTCVQIFA